MIGVAVGDAGMLVIDFDPRSDDIVDEVTGEIICRDVWTLDRLKDALAIAMGEYLPATLVGITHQGSTSLQLGAGSPATR